MPTVLDGSRATAASQGILSAKRKIEMHDEILLLDPEAGPFTVLVKQLPRQVTGNPKFDVLKDELIPEVTRINSAAGYTASVTTLKVDNEEYMQAGDIIKVARTGEVMRVTSVSATDSTCTVSARSWGSTAAAAMVDNDQIIILSNAQAESSSSPTAKSTTATSASNYIQVVRDPVLIGDVVDASNLYGGDELAYQVNKKGVEHLRKIEWSLWFSEAAQLTSGAQPIRTTGGIDEHITTNETDFGGVFNAVDMEAALRAAFRHGDKSKMFFVSREVASEISLAALGYLEQVRSDDTFGLDIVRYVSPHGSLMITVNDLFSESDYIKERGYIVDMSQYRYVYMTGEFANDTTLWTNIQNPDEAMRKDEWRTYFGLWRGHEKPSSRLKGITT